jgi:hypothetical protein
MEESGEVNTQVILTPARQEADSAPKLYQTLLLWENFRCPYQ